MWAIPGPSLAYLRSGGKFAMAEMLPAWRDQTDSLHFGKPLRGIRNGEWEMVKLLERHGGIVYAANAATIAT